MTDNTENPPLGTKNPLLPGSSLGQNFLSPKFISPLGSQSLINSDPLAVSSQESLTPTLVNNSFDNSLSLNSRPLSQSNHNNIIQTF
ncbi:hypothetical protein, partial [Anabaena sp. UHCC 0204]|uniref:hypothetical protein n=1 Tax=Anabaena sp. UHCC 0204 TaxID=2590009 RepID=UPI0014473563